MSIRFNPLTPVIAAEVSGIDLRMPLTANQAQEIHDGMDRYAVLVFHDQELTNEQQAVVSEAYGRIEDEEDEHLYHTQGWARELWLDALGLPAQLPPPEEEQDVTSAVEAQEAKETRHPGH